jgi:hypothetical protein
LCNKLTLSPARYDVCGTFKYDPWGYQKFVKGTSSRLFLNPSLLEIYAIGTRMVLFYCRLKELIERKQP